MYGKETIELEDVRQMLQNNELIKKVNFTEDASSLFVKARGKDERVGDAKVIKKLLAISLATFAKNQGTSRKIV